MTYLLELWQRWEGRATSRWKSIIKGLAYSTGLSGGVAGLAANLGMSNLVWFFGAIAILLALTTVSCSIYAVFFATESSKRDIPSANTFLQRDKYVGALKEKLLEVPSGILVVTGESGTGKSTLVRELLPKELPEPETWENDVIAPYRGHDDFKENLRLTLKEKGIASNSSSFHKEAAFTIKESAARRLLIFDQFEHFLYASLNDEDLAAWFRRFVEKWANVQEKRYCILILRREAFAGLGFLDRANTRIFGSTFWLRPITFSNGVPGTDEDDSDLRDAMLRLDKVVNDGDTLKEINNDLRQSRLVLPLEIDMIAKTLEDIKGTKRAISRDEYERLGRKSGLIRRYFLRAIEAAPDKEAASAVLFALSCSATTRYLEMDDIRKATHRDQAAVDSALTSLLEGPLHLVVATGSHYAVAHDYIAKVFEEFSSQFLDSTDRANIRYFTDLLADTDNSEQERTDVIPNEEPRTFTPFDFVFLVVIVGIVARFFKAWPPIDQHWIGATASPHGAIVDWRYAPAGLASMSCALYCWQFFRNILFKMSEGQNGSRGTRRALTSLTAALVCLMIFLGTLLPHLWLAFACVAGIAIGARLALLCLGLSYRPIERSKNFLYRLIIRYLGFLTLGFASFGIGLGLLRYSPGLSARLSDWEVLAALTNFDQKCGFFAEWTLAFFMFCYMLASWSVHAKRQRAGMVLGEWDRMRLS